MFKNALQVGVLSCLIILPGSGRLFAETSKSKAVLESKAVDIDEQLNRFNQTYRNWYQSRTQQTLQQLPLILIITSSSVILIKQNYYQEYPLAMREFKYVKTVLHAILGLYGIVSSTENPAQPFKHENLNTLASSLKELEAMLTESRLAIPQQEQVSLLLKRLMEIVDHSSHKQVITLEMIDSILFNELRPIAMKLIEHIGNQHAQELADVLSAIKHNSTDQEWQAAIAVILGGATARRGNLETAVTARVMGDDLLGQRIFYAENIRTPEQALSFVQALIGDSQLSHHLFHDRYRLWRDLFADISHELVPANFYTDLIVSPDTEIR